MNLFYVFDFTLTTIKIPTNQAISKATFQISKIDIDLVDRASI